MGEFWEFLKKGNKSVRHLVRQTVKLWEDREINTFFPIKGKAVVRENSEKAQRKK